MRRRKTPTSTDPERVVAQQPPPEPFPPFAPPSSRRGVGYPASSRDRLQSTSFHNPPTLGNVRRDQAPIGAVPLPQLAGGYEERRPATRVVDERADGRRTRRRLLLIPGRVGEFPRIEKVVALIFVATEQHHDTPIRIEREPRVVSVSGSARTARNGLVRRAVPDRKLRVQPPCLDRLAVLRRFAATCGARPVPRRPLTATAPRVWPQSPLRIS